MIDTVILVGTCNESHEVEGCPLNSQSDEEIIQSETQWSWLQDQLNNSKDIDYLFVAGYILFLHM